MSTFIFTQTGSNWKFQKIGSNLELIFSKTQSHPSQVCFVQVSKEWKRLVFNAESEAELKTFKYSSARKCLKCDQKFIDSADMFIHIRNVHVRKSVNKSCEKCFGVFVVLEKILSKITWLSLKCQDSLLHPLP